MRAFVLMPLMIALTAAGKKVMSRAPDAAQARIIAGLNGLPARERARLARGIQRLVREMGVEGRKAAMFLEDQS